MTGTEIGGWVDRNKLAETDNGPTGLPAALMVAVIAVTLVGIVTGTVLVWSLAGML